MWKHHAPPECLTHHGDRVGTKTDRNVINRPECSTSVQAHKELTTTSDSCQLTVSTCWVSSAQCWICDKLYQRTYAQPGCSTHRDKCKSTITMLIYHVALTLTCASELSCVVVWQCARNSIIRPIFQIDTIHASASISKSSVLMKNTIFFCGWKSTKVLDHCSILTTDYVCWFWSENFPCSNNHTMYLIISTSQCTSIVRVTCEWCQFLSIVLTGLLAHFKAALCCLCSSSHCWNWLYHSGRRFAFWNGNAQQKLSVKIVILKDETVFVGHARACARTHIHTKFEKRKSSAEVLELVRI